MSEQLPLISSSWQQDGLAVEHIEARLTGTVGIIDEDANAVTLNSEGVAIVRFHVYDVAAKINKKTGDTLRKVVLEASECRILQDHARAQRLLVDLGFADATAPIPTTAVVVRVNDDGEIVASPTGLEDVVDGENLL